MFNFVGTLLVMLIGVFADAQTDGHNLPKIQIENASIETKHILKEFQQVFGGGDQSNRVIDAVKYITSRQGFINWVKSFNLKRGFSHATRIYFIHSKDSRMSMHVSNLAFAIPLSQAIEMLSGPTLTSLSTAVGLPPYVSGFFSIGGAIISIPGIDPVCILMFATYPYKPVQNTLTWMREKTFSAITFTGDLSGITKIAHNVAQSWHVSMLYRYHHTISFTDNAVIILLPTGSTLHFIWDASREYFLGLRFKSNDLINIPIAELNDLLLPLPGNVRTAVRDLRELLRNEAPSPFYIDAIEQEEDGYISVTWRPRAVRSDFLSSCVDLIR